MLMSYHRNSIHSNSAFSGFTVNFSRFHLRSRKTAPQPFLLFLLLSSQSVASDMRFELFAESDVKQNSKRQRVINSRYREDYIEPVIYRAIME